jgi:hypothetical protein
MNHGHAGRAHQGPSGVTLQDPQDQLGREEEEC